MNMGIGNVGLPGVIFKRKFRYTLEINTPSGLIPKHYIKLAARPKFSSDSTEIPFLHSTTWIPGRVKWEPITVSYWDVPSADMAPLWSWIASIYNFQNSVNPTMSEKAGWNGVGNLIGYDGCGVPIEQWTLGSMYPESVDFGEVDNSSSDILTIELQLRYSEVTYQSSCGPNPNAQCVGCS